MGQEQDPNRRRNRREWFAQSGLAECDGCGQRSLVRTVEGDGYCIDCGYVEGIIKRASDGEPQEVERLTAAD